MEYDWNEDKDALLRERYGIGFSAVLEAISNGFMLEEIDHPKPERYPGQRMFLVAINNYVWAVPFVPGEGRVFSKDNVPKPKIHGRIHERRLR